MSKNNIERSKELAQRGEIARFNLKNKNKKRDKQNLGTVLTPSI